MQLRIVYETHAITEDNERGIATGWLPGKLSKAGVETARALGERRATGLDAVYVSDLARAVETAQIAFSGSTLPVIEDPRLRECNYGKLNGAPVEVLRDQRRRRIRVPFPGGESYEDVVMRTREFLVDLLGSHDGGTVLLISHSANRWALQHLIMGVPLEDLVDADFDWQPGWEYLVDTSLFPHDGHAG